MVIERKNSITTILLSKAEEIVVFFFSSAASLMKLSEGNKKSPHRKLSGFLSEFSPVRLFHKLSSESRTNFRVEPRGRRKVKLRSRTGEQEGKKKSVPH